MRPAHLAPLLLAPLLVSCGQSSAGARRAEGFREIEPVINSVRHASFPQLESANITVYDLRSDFDYLQARFTVASFFARKLEYMVFFNPEAIRRGVPANGLRAIVAHELAHINYYESQSRMGLLSLVGLLLPSFTTRFERKADLDAIALGYGRGLEAYRTWLYRNIPKDGMAEKKRDYYSPEEIEALLNAEARHPGMMRKFLSCVPRNLGEIAYPSRDRQAAVPAGACPK